MVTKCRNILQKLTKVFLFFHKKQEADIVHPHLIVRQVKCVEITITAKQVGIIFLLPRISEVTQMGKAL